MTNFILESEQRVGSRWVHYLLADLLGKKPSPEIDGRYLMIHHMETREKIQKLFSENRIPKIHHIHYLDLRHALFPLLTYKVLTVVRNPRDRAVSVAFHHAFDTGKAEWPQKKIMRQYQSLIDKVDTEEEKNKLAEQRDRELVEYTVLHYDRYFVSNNRMLSSMASKVSASEDKTIPYIDRTHMWIPYESLKKNPATEFNRVVDYLGMKTVMPVDEAIELHSFENKAKRKAGEEDRTDIWRRKGVVGDWTNWFTDEMIQATEHHHDLYNAYLDVAGYST